MKPLSLRGPFAGLNRQSDPAGMRDGQFFALINARLSPNGVVVVCRGGQEKVNTGGVVSGCPELIFDAGDLGFVPEASMPVSGGAIGDGSIAEFALSGAGL